MYVSQGREDLTADQISEIAKKSARNNAEVDVTGLLAFNSRSFMQLLEGRGEDVLAVMRRIEADDRHEGITFIRQDERERRECPNWSMHQLIAPLSGARSAEIFTRSLPPEMELDTRVLFTSFASSLSADEAEAYAKREDKLLDAPPQASNDVDG
jgi:hypothetical protein